MGKRLKPKNEDPKIPYSISLSTSLVNDIKYLKKTDSIKLDRHVERFLRDQVPFRI